MSEAKQIYDIQDSKMYLDENDSLNLTTYGVYEPEETELIKQILKPTDICLDIGAHIGYFTLIMAKRCKWVYAFEPEAHNYSTLFKNISQNNINNVSLYHNIVSYFPGISTLYVCNLNSGMHRAYPSKWCDGGTQQVDCVVLDELIPKADFIKMDCEGSELGALQGMSRLLLNNDIKMIMEFHPMSIREYGADPRDVYNFMRELGYNIMLLPDKDTPIQYEDLLSQTQDINGGRNLYCVKP